MQYLEEKHIGFETGAAKVPLVCASCIYDLIIGASNIRPDKTMGYQACENAQVNLRTDGCIGVGTGATVGKFLGPASMMKSGLGSYAIQIGELKIGAIVAVNALGDIFDTQTGMQIAGPLHAASPDMHTEQAASADSTVMLCTEELICHQYSGLKNLFTGNTTIGAIITNGNFTKTEMNKIAAMAQNGLARSINPVHTTADGDSVYALSVGDISADLNVTGTLAAQVMSSAITRAIYSAESMCGVPSYQELFSENRLQK